MNGAGARSKGCRIEREIVHLLQEAGIVAERVPLSGGQGGSYTGDVMVHGLLCGSLKCEVKARAGGDGFKTLEGWLGDNDLLFLRRDRRPPMVVMEMGTLLKLMADLHLARG